MVKRVGRYFKKYNMYLSKKDAELIGKQFHTGKIKEGYEIMKQFRETISRSKKFQIGFHAPNYPLHNLSSTTVQSMMSQNYLTFYFEAKMYNNHYGFPSNVGSKVVDVISIGKGYFNIYTFKKGNGVKGKSNLDTTISEALPNQLDVLKQSIHWKHSVPLDKIKCYIVIFTTEDPLWKKKAINHDVIWGKDLCRTLGIVNKYQSIVNSAVTNSSQTLDDTIDEINSRITNEFNRKFDEKIKQFKNKQ